MRKAGQRAFSGLRKYRCKISVNSAGARVDVHLSRSGLLLHSLLLRVLLLRQSRLLSGGKGSLYSLASHVIPKLAKGEFSRSGIRRACNLGGEGER